MTQRSHIKGMALHALLSDLSSDLVADAEIPAEQLALVSPPAGQGGVRRCLGRVTQSGWFVSAVSLAVAFAVVIGLAALGRRGSSPPVGPAGSLPTGTEGATAPYDRPVSDKAVNYTLRTDLRVYYEGVTRITVHARGNQPGEAIPPYASWDMKCLSHPDRSISFQYTEEALEQAPFDERHHAYWNKTLQIPDGLLPGLYRVHHCEYDHELSAYVSVAQCDFAVGEDYRIYVEDGANPDTTSS